MSNTTDLIDEQLAAWRARNLDEFISFYSPSAVIRDGDGNVLMEGELEMRQVYGPLFRDSPDLRVAVPRRIEIGDFVIDEELVDGAILEGVPGHQHVVTLYRVKGSKICEVTFLS